MKSFKLTATIIISIIIMFSTISTAFCVNTNNENYEILLEHGFTEDYLDSLTDSMLNKMVTQIKKVSDPEYISDYDWLLSVGLPEEFIGNLPESALKQIKSALNGSNISALDYKSEAVSSNINSDVPIKTLSVQLTDNSGKSVVGETVCIYWEWPVNKPLIRDEDFISVRWNRDVFCYDADSFYAEDYRRNNPADNWTVSDNYSVLARSSLDSLGHWTKLYTTKKQIGGFIIFSLTPTHPIASDLDYDRSVYIDYTHEAETVSTVALSIVFVLLALSALCIVTKIRKRKKR